MLDTLGIKLLVTLPLTFRLPTLAVLVTFKLLDTFTKLAVAKLPKLAFNETILPLKLAVLPCKSLVILTLLALAMLPWTTISLAKFAKLAVTRLPKLALAAFKLPVKLATLPLNVWDIFT